MRSHVPLQPKPKITTAFASLSAFLSSPSVDALSAMKLIQNEDIRLWQLPNYDASRLQALGLKAGTADRIAFAASKHAPE